MTSEKIAKPSVTQHQNTGGAFFRKASEEGFFGSVGESPFFAAAIQPKLTVSQPDDPQEKEADMVADQVMRMAEPAAHVDVSNQDNEVGESTLSRMPDPVELPISSPEDEGQHKLDRKDDGRFTQPFVMRKCDACESKGDVQTKLMRKKEDAYESYPSAPAITNTSIGGNYLHPKAHAPPSGNVIQRSGRSPPAPAGTFESSLQSTKGAGSPLSLNTRQSLEGRFGADFSSVRIHTGTQAESLSANIHAQAFTHGGDIYFNSGKFSPDTAEGSHLLAHELTHTIQQGASRPASSGSNQSGTIAPRLQRLAGPHSITSSPPSLQRSAVQRPVPSQLNNAVEKAKAEEGKVNANKEGPDGYRTGWERLTEYFKTTLGEDKVVSAGGAGVQGAIAEQDIKKKREIDGPVPAHPKREKKGPYMRDAMPSWCGIFVFWALHKAGVPMKPWGLGGRNVTPDAAYPPGYTPQPGDIAYRNDFSHFAIVEKASGDTITTVNGNTAGEDNLGGQVQTRDHPRSGWTAFFDPLMLKDGPLTSGETSAEEVKPLSIKELRKKLFNVDRKSETEEATDDAAVIQPKPQLSNYGVNAAGSLQRNATPVEEEKLQKKEEEKKEEDKIGGMHDHTVQKKDDNAFTAGQENPEHLSSDATGPGIQSLAQGYQESTATADVLPYPIVDSSRGPPSIQRSWLGDAWDAVGDTVGGAIEWAEDQINEAKEWILGQIRDFVSNIPGYRLLTLIIEEDPVTGADVTRTGANMLDAGLGVMPLGDTFREVLISTGTYDEAAAFVEGRVGDFVTMASGIGSRVSGFIDGLGLSDIGDPQQVLEDIASLMQNIITDIVSFITRSSEDFLAMIKRIMINLVVDFVRSHIPRLYPFLTVLLGHDPVTDQEVVRNGTNILNALFNVTDEGVEQRRQLQETGAFQKVADWIDQGIGVFTDLYITIRDGFTSIWEVISIESLANPTETFDRIYNQFSAPVLQVWNYISETADIIIAFIKEALLSRLSAWAREQRGYFLITLLIRRDPFTNATVPFTVENVIHAFMSLMEGGEEQFQQMKESGAIDRTTNRVLAAVRRLDFTPEYIVGLFTGLWTSFKLSDLADPEAVFARIVGTFAQPVRRLVAFVAEIIKIVVEVVLQLMEFPTDLVGNIINRAMQAWDRIKRDPVGFLKNLLRAIKQGFVQFFDNILDHLTHGLTGWLMSELRDAGVPELTDFTPRGIIGWVLQVLGISMEAIWQKLAAHPRIGPERVERIRGMIGRLEGIWTFIRDVQERGMAAIWDKIEEQLSNLWDTVIDAVKNWIMEQIVNKVIEKLLSMLDPTGIMAVINSAIAFYRAIQTFIRYLREILEVVNSFVEGLADIAAGNVETAANFLEATMRRAMPIMIGFLANQVGLSGIGHRIAELIGRARELVDQALTWLVDRAVSAGMNLLDRVAGGARELVGGGGTPQERLTNGLRDAQQVVNRFAGRRVGSLILAPLLGVIRLRYGFQTLEVVARGNVWAVRGQINPEGELATDAQVDAAAGTSSNEQATLEALVAKVPPAYPVDSLGRAGGSAGHVQGVKDSEEREDIPTLLPIGYLPGDHRGHLIGDRFYGISAGSNIVPMHRILNLSTFKSYENSLANRYKHFKDQNKGVLLYMSITPNYAGSNATDPSHFRPYQITANSKIITLKDGANPPQAEEQIFNPSPFDNPTPVIAAININTVPETSLIDLFGAELGRMIFSIRSRRFADFFDLQERLLLRYPDQTIRLNENLRTKEHLINFR